MTAREYIDKNLQPLHADASVEEAIAYLVENKLSETFIFSEEKDLLLLKLAEVISEDESNSAKLFASPFHLKLSGDMHWSQLLTFYSTLNVEVLPVYDQNFYFAGLISKANLVACIADFKSLEEPGAMLQLECDPYFYAASEVIRIAEMYNVRVVALFTHLNTQTQKLSITLKLNIQETKGISSTYERFGYDVTNVFMNKDMEGDVYTDRYESLLRVLDL